MDWTSTSKISYKNNPFNYMNGKEQYVTNPHAKLDYRVTFSSDRYRSATVATYQMDYGKWKIINLGDLGTRINKECSISQFF